MRTIETVVDDKHDVKTAVCLISGKTITWVSLGGRWGSNIEDNLNIQAVPKKIICLSVQNRT